MIPRVSAHSVRSWFSILPAGAMPETRLLLVARGLRAIGDGLVSLLLPVYLLELGHGPFETGVIATATLAGSALLMVPPEQPPSVIGGLEQLPALVPLAGG